MKHSAKKAYTVKLVNGWYKVYDRDSKFRQQFLTQDQAETFGRALTSHQSRHQAVESSSMEAL